MRSPTSCPRAAARRHRVRHGRRGRAEVEAESVAFLVLTTSGPESGAYSFPYVAAWSGGEARACHCNRRPE